MPITRKQQAFLNQQLIQAAAAGRTAEIEQLKHQGADLNAVEQGATPLTAATAHNQLDAVRTLVTLGARIDLPDAQGNTPLSHALRNDNPAIGQMLMQLGAGRTNVNALGDNVLTEAVRHDDGAMVDQLIRFNADVNLTSRWSVSALRLAGGNADMVRRLLDAKADLGHPANQYVLHSALDSKLHDVLQLLLSAGANPNALNEYGRAPLVQAAEQANPDLVRSLIAANADPNQAANQQAIPMALAADSTAVVQALLDGGARLDLDTRAGRDALTHAITQGNAAAMAHWFPPDSASLADMGWSHILLPFAVRQSTAEIVEILGNAGFPTDIVDEFGQNLLMMACTQGDPDMVRVLLAQGVDPHAVDNTGRCALHHAERCIHAHQRNEVKLILLETIAARALERSGMPARPCTSFADLLERLDDEVDAGEHGGLDASDQDALVQWTDTMNDIDEGPWDEHAQEEVETAGSGIPSLLPYHYM